MLALELIPRLTQAFLRHVFAYGELLCEESTAAWRLGRRRALGWGVTCIGGLMALVLGCLWVIAATWNGPSRLVAVGSLCIGFGLVAVVGALYAGGGRASGAPRPFERLREEWRADMREIGRLDPTLTGQSPAPISGISGGDSAGHE